MSTTTTSSAHDQENWSRHYRGIAVLHIASRSYPAAQNTLLRCLQEIYETSKVSTYRLVFQDKLLRCLQEIYETSKVSTYRLVFEDKLHAICDIPELPAKKKDPKFNARPETDFFIESLLYRDGDSAKEDSPKEQWELHEALQKFVLEYRGDYADTMMGDVVKSFCSLLTPVENKNSVKQGAKNNKRAWSPHFFWINGAQSLLGMKLSEIGYQQLLAFSAFECLRDHVPKIKKPSLARELVKVATRQMQLSLQTCELINYAQELELEFGPSTKDSYPSRGKYFGPKTVAKRLTECNYLAQAAGDTAFKTASRVVDHFGRPEFPPKEQGEDGDDATQTSNPIDRRTRQKRIFQTIERRENERRRLLEEMKRLETYSAALKRARIGRKNDELDRLGQAYLAPRGLDHAIAWTAPSDPRSIPIVLLQKAAYLIRLVEVNLSNRNGSPQNQATQADRQTFKESDLLTSYIRDSITDRLTERHGAHLINLQRGSKTVRELVQSIVDDLSKDFSQDDPDTRNSFSLGEAEGMLKMAEQVLNDAGRALEDKNQNVWWLGFLQQLRLELHRLRLAFCITRKVVPSELSTQVKHGWQLTCQCYMERANSILYLDTIRFARCFHVYCDSVLYVWTLNYLDDQLGIDYVDSIGRLSIDMNDLRKELDRKVDQKLQLEENEKFNHLCFGSGLNMIYLGRVIANYKRISTVVSLTKKQFPYGNC